MIILNSKNWKKLRWNSNRLLLVCVISLFNFINTEELLTEEETGILLLFFNISNFFLYLWLCMNCLFTNFTEFCTQTAFHKLSQRRYVSSRKVCMFYHDMNFIAYKHSYIVFIPDDLGQSSGLLWIKTKFYSPGSVCWITKKRTQCFYPKRRTN